MPKIPPCFFFFGGGLLNRSDVKVVIKVIQFPHCHLEHLSWRKKVDYREATILWGSPSPGGRPGWGFGWWSQLSSAFGSSWPRWQMCEWGSLQMVSVASSWVTFSLSIFPAETKRWVSWLCPVWFPDINEWLLGVTNFGVICYAALFLNLVFIYTGV